MAPLLRRFGIYFMLDHATIPMLKVAYHASTGELLVDGRRDDYDRLVSIVRHVLSSGDQETVPFESTGTAAVSALIVRRGSQPNRVSLEDGGVVISVAPTLAEQFLSFVEF